MQTTLGIDLASQPQNTALCVVAWEEDGRAQVRALARSDWDGRALDDALLSAAARGDAPLAGGWGDGGAGRPVKVGVDAPFGWPQPFVDAIAAHHRLRPWPLQPAAARAYALRATDEFVHARIGKTPLSVSTDKIAYPAMRCARLLGDLERRLSPAAVARDGSGLVAETYPDAALRIWLAHLWPPGRTASYKRGSAAAADRRRAILGDLRAQLGDRFRLDDEQGRACVESDDCLDALVCALVARAAALGLTVPPPAGDVGALAQREGWIHLPEHGSLRALLRRS